jgi:lysophospholipid acyltransferase (LPLAT)-like uncharacterized protein
MKKWFKIWIKKLPLHKLAAILMRLVGATLRVEVIGEEYLQNDCKQPYIFASWHNRLLLIPYFQQRLFPNRLCSGVISLSGDGELIAKVAKEFGMESIRGSSSKNGHRALLEAVRLLKNSKSDIGITPDGPRGPKYFMHQGVFQMSQLMQLPITALAFDYEKKWELKSWDAFQIPKPFSKCTLKFSAPIGPIPKDASLEELQEFQKQLEKEMSVIN